MPVTFASSQIIRDTQGGAVTGQQLWLDPTLPGCLVWRSKWILNQAERPVSPRAAIQTRENHLKRTAANGC